MYLCLTVHVIVVVQLLVVQLIAIRHHKSSISYVHSRYGVPECHFRPSQNMVKHKKDCHVDDVSLVELHAVEVAKAAPKRPGGTVLDSPFCAFLAHEVQLGREMKFECV